ncbi:MAG: methyltransferase domain-containing protein [Solirubrobacterales bacterium]|nr:methyltransferase domain-containing protein [Solirubrobacterales bacterium]
MSDPVEVIWHDLECGRYTADLPLWRRLAERLPGPVIDVGAGTGRTTLDLAAAGHEVLALDLCDALLEALRDRGEGLAVRTIVGDARAFGLGEQFGLCIVPMQTIQLLGGAEGRAGFWRCAVPHLAPGGVVAIAIADSLECFETVEGGPGPLPDVIEVDNVVYSSRPTGVRVDATGFELERRRELVTPDGRLEATRNLIHLDAVTADTLEDEGREAGLRPIGRIAIEATDDYVGATAVMLRA